MSKRLFFILPIILFFAVFSYYEFGGEKQSEDISVLREKHARFLKELAPKKDAGLSRLEKIQQALPPNQYYELMEFLTMNPALGYPEPYKVRELHEKLMKMRRGRRSYLKAPGETTTNEWVSRGPNNVGGRTRVLLFDPNDPTGKRVFAGAVSGGLWYNNDITRETSAWQQANGLPANLNVSCLTVDPRDSNIWYVGTGEQYTGGDVVGTGVYKTTDGGENWSKVLDVEEFSRTTTTENVRAVGGLYYINDIEAWDNGSSTEVFIGVSSHVYANAENPENILGFFERGLYGSKNGGGSWSKILADDSFNDFETDANGNLWVATTYSPGEGSGSRGGKIFKREKGENTDFSLINTVTGVLRTEIEASATNPLKFYILAETAATEQADMFITTDAFATISPLNEPTDVDDDIPAGDFARNQAFYNLMIESDPTNDEIVYAGGIDLFRSENSGQSWEQISKWANNNDLANLDVSLVHADQHVMRFRPGNTNQAVFAHDGGVSFASDLAAANSSKVIITPEINYITTQFYSIAVAPSSFANGDYFLGGTQDNGTQLIQNGNPESVGILGGDGAHSFYDQVDTKYLIANLVYNDLIVLYDYSKEDFALIAYNEDKDGFFINPQALDSNLDKLYSNGPEGVLYRYDDLTELEPVGDDGISDDDETAPRTSLTNALLNTSISAITVSPYTTNSSTVVLGLTNGRLLLIKNADGNAAEATWTNISGSQFLGSISDVEYGQNEDELYVTFYNYGVRSIWYTENATAANPVWTNKEGNLPDLPVLTILPNPLNEEEVIIGTELGIWATSDFKSDSPTWEQAYNGMSDVKVTDLDLKKGANVAYAASYGRGMFSGQFKASATPPLPEESKPIVVFPAVSRGIYNIAVKEDIEDVRIDVFNLQGKLVETVNTSIDRSSPFELELWKQASGMYLVRVKGGGQTVVQKIVKKNYK